MNKIKLRWKNYMTAESDYYRSWREALERAINITAGFCPPGTLARDIREEIGGPMARAWRETLDREGLEIVHEETVRFEELCKGDAVKIEKVCDGEDVLGLFDGFEVEFVDKTNGYQKWPEPELEISSGHLFVHRNCKWLKVME